MKTALEDPPPDNPGNVTEPKLRHQPPRARFWQSMAGVWRRKTSVITAFSATAILVHVILRFGFRTRPEASHIPLLATLAFGGTPLVYELLKKPCKTLPKRTTTKMAAYPQAATQVSRPAADIDVLGETNA